MGCCDHLSTSLAAATPNASMHVNFVKGMVLGVDDYRQEFTYLSNGYQWAVRDLIGYGTASGLAVRIEDDGSSGPRIEVSPGSAVPPSARMICVGSPQCGWLNKWLAQADVAKELTRRLSGNSPPDLGAIDVYLTLCFRDCDVLPVPIPGEPCRSDDELMTPSRVADDYVLSLSFDAPEQTEADAIARLVAFIDQVEVEPVASPPESEQEEEDSWKAALHALFPASGEEQSPPSSPPALGSPPAPLTVAEHRYDEFLRYIFRLWVTEVRPGVMARRCGTDANASDDCLLLARLGVPVLKVGDADDRGWEVDGGAHDIVVDESRRPMIVPLHLVQTVLGMAVGAEEGGATSSGPAGPPGDPGAAASISIGTVQTLPPGTPASVTNVGTASAAVLDFGIPEGQPGAAGGGGGGGAGASVAVGTVTALPPGSPPTVVNSGTAQDAIFDFGIPEGQPGSAGSDGASASVNVGTVVALPAGSAPTVANSGTPQNAVFDFAIPQGDAGAAGQPGAAATVAVGTVTTVPAGTPASVTNSGNAQAAVLDFQIPEGAQGPQGPQGSPIPFRVHPWPKPIPPNFNINADDPRFDTFVIDGVNGVVTLPATQAAGEGRVYIFRSLAQGATIAVTGNDKLEGNPRMLLRPGTGVMLMADPRNSRWVALLDLNWPNLLG